MKTFIAIATYSETGSCDSVTFASESPQKGYDGVPSFLPWLGAFDDSLAFRGALGDALTRDVKHFFQLEGIAHGHRLVYVSPACSTYVFEIDFDNNPTEEKNA